MSVRVMTAVWALSLPDSEKIVLLALADSANDEGHCWPGMRSLMAKCSKSDRTIQAAIKALCAAGHLTRREVPGKGCNYTVHPRSAVAPEVASPPKGTAQTPEAASGKPSLTVNTEAKASLGVIPEAWNKMAARFGMGSVRVLDNSRKQKLRCREKEHGEAVMLEAIERVGRSKFLTGRGDKPYKANFDFILQPESLRKLLEGFYGEDDAPVGRARPMTAPELRNAIRFRRDNGDEATAAKLEAELAQLEAPADPVMQAAIFSLPKIGQAA